MAHQIPQVLMKVNLALPLVLLLMWLYSATVGRPRIHARVIFRKTLYSTIGMWSSYFVLPLAVLVVVPLVAMGGVTLGQESLKVIVGIFALCGLVPPFLVVGAGIVRMVIARRNLGRWRKAWRSVITKNKDFVWPQRTPKTREERIAFFHTIPSLDAPLAFRYLQGGSVILPCLSDSFEEIFGTIAISVLSNWAERRLPNPIVYRSCGGGSGMLWIRIQVDGTKDAEACLLFGISVKQFGGIVQVDYGGHDSYRIRKRTRTISGESNPSDYVNVGRYLGDWRRGWRMMPGVAYMYLPGILNPKWEATKVPHRNVSLFSMTGSGGESEEEVIIDMAREEGGLPMTLSHLHEQQMTQLKQALERDLAVLFANHR